jgi:small subunit ribosomal protein S14
MAKISMVEREKKRTKVFEKFREKRQKLKEAIVNLNLSDEERWEAQQKFQAMPRDASYSRQRSRCRMCGRSRAYNRLTGLCRIHMRGAVMTGLVPGMHKASW